MRLSKLFESYSLQLSSTPEVNEIFLQSGMIADSGLLDYGFFPLGSGILTEQSLINEAEIEEGGTMVLGHDFGTISYVKNKCHNKRENNSKTIQNLSQIGLKLENTFFTNFYLGLRDDINHPGNTMTKLAVKRQQEYKFFCFNFFQTQLQLINPKIIICLGKEVGLALPGIFSTFIDQRKSLLSMYADESDINYIVYTNDQVYGKRKFILIPHPSYAHINWAKHNIKAKIQAAVQS